jgi:hypothetical protein
MSDTKDIAVIDGKAEVVKANLPELFKEANLLHEENARVATRVAENAVRIGVVLNQIRDTVGHEEFLPTLEKHCPKISQRTCYNYMDLAAQLAIRQICNVANLKKLPPSERPAEAKKQVKALDWNNLPFEADALVKHVDGKNLTAVYREYGVIKPPKKDGGFRPDADAVHAWLEKHHPKLLGTAYEELPVKLQKAFKKQYRPKALPPEMIADAKRAEGSLAFDMLAEQLHEKTYVHWEDEFRGSFRKLLKDYVAALDKTMKDKKAKEEEQ